MPIIKRRSRRRREDFAELTVDQRRFLKHGDTWFGTAFESIDDMAVAWEMHAEPITDKFVAKHPGHRPFAWWILEHEHERPIMTHNRIPPAVLDRHRAETWGYLHTKIWCCPGWLQEPEPDYLQRLGLLEFGEPTECLGF